MSTTRDTLERRVDRLEKGGGDPPCPECAARNARPPRLVLPIGEPGGPTSFFDFRTGEPLDPAEVEAPKRCPGCGCTVEPVVLEWEGLTETDLHL